MQCVWFLFGGVDGRRCWSLSPSSPLPFRPLLLSHFAVALCQTVVRGICTLFCAGSVSAPGAFPVFCVVHCEVPCVPPASPVSKQQGPEFFFLPFSELLLPGVKGDSQLPFPWWLAAPDSSSVHSTFSVVGNKTTPGPSKSTVLEVRVLPPPPGTGRWQWDGGAGCPLCPWAEWSWEVGSKQRAVAHGRSKVTELQQDAVRVIPASATVQKMSLLGGKGCGGTFRQS